MSMNEPRSIHAAEDWGVLLQSVPSKHKKEIVKRLGEIFQIDKHDAEQVLANMPLILVDSISFGLAARIKNYFQKLGAVSETTNHDMIKKNCFQIVWPQTPDLSFFMKDETKPAEVPAPGKTAAKPAMESSPKHVWESPAPAVTPQPSLAPEQKPTSSTPSGADSDWERRAKELNEKLRKIQDEKQQMHAEHIETTERVTSEFRERLDQEKQKKEEIAQAYKDLQKEAQKKEALTKEGEDWRAKAMVLGEKVRGLETELMQKTSAIEHLIQQKDDLTRRSEKAAELSIRVADLEKSVAASEREKTALQSHISDAQRELESLRGREQEWAQKAGAMERSVQEMTEALRTRDNVLAKFEKQMTELAKKVQDYESLRQEHEQLVQERATIRKGYDAKLVEQEVRLTKAEEEHRRYRSRADRKTAAATRELGEWVRGVDTLRQGLQKLILFLGSESAVLDTEKNPP